MTTELRALPSVDRMLAHPEMKRLVETFSREPVTELVRRQLEQARLDIGRGKKAPTLDELVQTAVRQASELWQTGPKAVINGTGVIIHTNLGRAPLSREATEAMLDAAKSYSNLEYEVDAGERGSRQQHATQLLRQLTGAEDALVVNNNASAVLLALTSLAKDREVVVSRGEAVEIGGGFRIPDVLRQSWAVLVEVGTTNRTYLRDYEAALTPQTAALLKVHASNFRVTGFTHAATLEELVALGAQHAVPVLHDLGSGCLIKTERFGLAHEPTPQESVAAEVDLVCFSADKLLGGPQGGIVVGKKALVSKLARHPLARAMRIDKLSLAALSSTLLHYLKDEAEEKVPVWQMIARSPEELEAKASEWRTLLGVSATVIKGESTIGGGSLPGETLPTWLLALDTEGVPGGAKELARRLREGSPPVIARIVDERVVLDPRTVFQEEESLLLKVVREAVG